MHLDTEKILSAPLNILLACHMWNFKNWHDGGNLPEQLSCDRVWIQHEGVQESSKSRGGRRDGGRPQYSAARHASSQQSKYKIHSRMTQFYRKCICYKRFSFSSIRSRYEINVSWWWGVLLKDVSSHDNKKHGPEYI